jgi:hypothetical protein
MKFGIMLGIILLIVAGSAALSMAWADYQSPETLVAPGPEDVPDTIAGHEVVAVITVEDNPCIGVPFRIILRSHQSSIDEMFDSGEPQDIRSALNRLGFEDVPLSIVGPYHDSDEIRSRAFENARHSKENGCRYLGERPLIKKLNPGPIACDPSC